MINQYLKKSLCVLSLILSVAYLKAQVISPFTSIYQTTQRGGVVFISNSALGCSANPPASIGVCQIASSETPLLGTTRNDDFSSAYIDVDGDALTFMSSSDSLNLPTCSNITKAFLFWGASGTGTPGYNQVKIKLNNGVYQTVTATFSTTNTTGITSYHCYADVTTLIQTNKCRVTIADIPSSELGTSNSFGSWNLVVVYKNDAMNMRQLNVMNGLAYSSLLTPTLNIPLSGFLTPTVSTVSFEVGAYSHDGDRGMTGDNIMFNGNLAFLPLTDILTNPPGDAMNSTVSNNGIANPFRKPILNNTMGSDADIYVPDNLLNLYLSNAATTATIQLVSGGDDYMTQCITTAIDSYEPALRLSLKAKDVNAGSLNPGDIIEYKLKGWNIGTDISLNTIITDTLPTGVNYIPNSVSIVFGPNTGSKTDIASDDQVDYNPTTRILKVRIGTGANTVNGGSLTGSPTGVDSTVVTYSVSVSQSCLRLLCDNTLKNRAHISGTGSVFSNTLSNSSSPGNDAFGCMLYSTTNSTVITSSCSSPTAASSSPVCSGNSFTLDATFDPEALYSWSGPSSYTSSLKSPTIGAATTAMSGMYTVTLSVPGVSCVSVASTSVIITVCPPGAVNDFTNTPVNIPVSGNAASNDINALPGGTFAILSQPANGTVVINSSTGQYTFTPATGFIGITTATYQLCNSLPVLCSTASITFTVYANVVANPDVINTTPSVTATGSLLTNDSGITPGATYSVSITQLPTGTGTLIINSSTGQYTFIPNPAFNGTAQTTYTLCNISVNPQQCSSTTITINVLPNPAPVNDNVVTVINIPVSGNVASNDGGVNGGTFSITVQPANGTITINPATGQFTYTPPVGFTGVTSATYNLCNGAPITCSTAVISITVYANVVANPDVINTTPSVIATGSLLTNDSGITPGASYSVSITQLSAGTGTLIINSSTGQYTFIPNPAFNGTAQTTYTLCNISVNPQQCSSTTITVNVLPNPAPANDNVATVINIPVSGNVASNDGGVNGGTFSITVQPANGTITINPATGQFTYTPPVGFTGVTSATYNLCNGAPITCSTAVISITVYPNIVANPDIINTTPLTTTTGSFLTNDTGVTPGATYSLSITQPPVTTGSITVNPSTGQYTFVPGVLFTGTAQVTYTVCNTNVNPQQCSSTNVTIIVSNLPVAIDDFTTTTINLPVNGNAGANDSGTLGGIFSFGSAGITGTFVGSSLTGLYTFTPAAGFTGTTSVTYTLCNLSSPPCATANIVITVYADLLANPDLINTTPSVTTTGNLLANDSGINASANYSVTVNQPASGTGTILINPSTGQYTFIPNTGFTGTVLTSYTVCNTSVNPQQCSVANITIAVGDPPVAVNDNVITTLNTNVTGDASLNDLFASGGTFSFGNMSPSAGIFTGNASTGQFTFVPAANFTGTASLVYTLCTIYSPPCSTAMISFTVFPTLMANPDLISTVINTSVSGNLISNDVGMVSNGDYSVALNPVSSTVGTITVNASSGQYTFNPSAGFIGTASTSYTLIQYNGTVQVQSSVTSITIVVTNGGMPAGLAKSIKTVSYNANGTIDLTYKVVIKNYSPFTASSLTVSDDLSTTFPSPTSFTILNPPVLTGSSGSQLAVDNNFTGKGPTVFLTQSNSALAPGRSDTIEFGVRIDPHGVQYTYNNFALLSAVVSGSMISDSSATGLNPDPDGNNDPGNNTSPTTFTFNVVKVGLAKSAGKSHSLGNGCYSVTFRFSVKNYGTNTAYAMQLTDDLNATFQSGASYTVLSMISVNGYLASDPGYNGTTNINLISAGSQLNGGQSDTLYLTVRYCTTSIMSFTNTATVYGNSLFGGGLNGIDVSTDGNDPDPDHNGNPSDVGENVPTVFMPSEDFLIPQGFSPNGDGINDKFEIKGISAFPEMEVNILNRWGNTVYTKKQYDNSWDGTSGEGVQYGNGQLPEGTYFYIIDLGDGQKPLKGFVYLNRAVK